MWRGIGAIGLAMVLAAFGCAATGQHDGISIQSMLLGKSEQDIADCAGEPKRRLEEGERVRLIYRNEPTVLERSFPSARSTVTCPHHGCEAHVIVQNGRAAQVEYHLFPEGGGDCDHCDRIFVRCSP